MFRGIYTAPPNADEGMQMVYVPDQQMVRFEAWTRQGRLQAADVLLGDFLRGLGIALEDCQMALGGGTPTYMQQGPAQPMARAASTAPVRPAAVPSQAPPPGP